MGATLQTRLTRAAELAELYARVARRRGRTDKAVAAEIQASVLREILDDLYPQAGDIGEPVRHVELEPLEEPVVPELDPLPEETPEKVPV